MPEKDGDDKEQTSNSVVNKTQKQMMNQEDYLPEEGYDIARDMGKVPPSKNKKDATTIPVSDEVKKTQKVNKGPSAFEIVKAKYGKSVMNGKKKANEELDLTKIAEVFGGYIIEAPVDDEGKVTAKKGEGEKTKKLISKIKKGREKGVESLSKKIGLKPDPEKLAARNAFIDMKKSGVTPTSDVERGIRSVESGKGPQEPQDQMSPTSGGKRKDVSIDAMKSPKLSPTTGGRRVVKKMSKKDADEIEKRIDAKIDPKQSARSDAKAAERQFRRGFKQSGVSGDFSPTMDPKLRKVRQAQRDARSKKLGTPDPFSVDTSTAAADVAKQFGTAPVAGGMKFPPTVATSTKRDGVTKMYREPVGPGGSTVPKKSKRESIPKDSGALSDTPRVKKRFSQLSQDLKDLKRDVKVDKDIEGTISKMDSKITQEPKKQSKNASNDPSFKIKGGERKDGKVELPKFSKSDNPSFLDRARKAVDPAPGNTRKGRIQSTVINTALKTAIPGLAGAQAGLEVSQGKYKDATLSAVQSLGGPIGFGAGVLRAVRKIRGTEAPRSVKTMRNPIQNVSVNRNTGNTEVVTTTPFDDDKIKSTGGGKLALAGALSKAPLRTSALTALGTQLPKLKGKFKGLQGVKGGKAIQVRAGK